MGVLRRVAGLLVAAVLLSAFVLGAWALTRPQAAMAALRWSPHRESTMLLLAAAGSCAGPLVLALVLLRRQARRVRSLRSLGAAQKGTVATEFLLVLPVLILLFGTVFQMGMLAHAQIVLRYAAFCAARSAIVAEDPLPNDLSDCVTDLANLRCYYRISADDANRAKQAAVAVLAGLQSSPGTPAGSGPSMDMSALARTYSAAPSPALGGYTASHVFGASAAGTNPWPDADYYLANYANAWARTDANVAPIFSPSQWAQAMLGKITGLADQINSVAGKLGKLGDFFRSDDNDSSMISSILDAIGIGSIQDKVADFADEVGSALAGPLQSLATKMEDVVEKVAPYAVNPLAPPTISATITYQFPLRMPSVLWFIYGYNDDYGCHVMPISKTITLQSPGGRSDMLPVLPLWQTTPLPGDEYDSNDR